MIGLQMAAAYSMKPNELGRCGPDGAHLKLYEFAKKPLAAQEPQMREILSQFEVAMPYYRLIARANGISNPFDQRVVEAYWLGNEFLDKVAPAAVRQVIEEDVKAAGWNRESIALLFSAILLKKAKPHHSLSVCYFFLQPGTRMFLTEEIKKRIDSCRVASGIVVNAGEEKIIVEYQPFGFAGDGKVRLGFAKSKEINRGFLPEVKKGDLVSFHLDWGVQKLSDEEGLNLENYTRCTLEVING